MEIAIQSNLPYQEVVSMTNNERKILIEILQEKADRESGKKRQQMMEPGKVNGPAPGPATRTEQR